MTTKASTALQVAWARRLARSGRGRAIREAATLSRSEFADELGVAASTVARWEGGTRTPRPEQALRYLALLEELELIGTPQ
jgi:DNA-binding transcriptional regulator YiaG